MLNTLVTLHIDGKFHRPSDFGLIFKRSLRSRLFTCVCVVKYVTRSAFRPVTVSSKFARFPSWGLPWSYCCWCWSAAPSWQPERPCPWTRSRTGMTRGCPPTEEGAAMVAGEDTAVAMDAGKASPQGWLREISYYYWRLILIGVNIFPFYLFLCLTNGKMCFSKYWIQILITSH